MDCIEHTQKGGRRGYAMARYMGRQMHLHRRVYCEANTVHPDDIEGLVIRHVCDNPRCINPAHLIEGTHAQNMEDMTRRKRQAVGVQHGLAKLDEDAVRFIRKHFKRYCKEFGGKALAKRFGVAESVIGAVNRNEIWTHVN